MTDEELKLLKSLPVGWQIAILESEIQRLENRPPPAECVWCWTPYMDMLESLEELRALLEEVKRPGYEPVQLVPESVPAKGWLRRILDYHKNNQSSAKHT